MSLQRQRRPAKTITTALPLHPDCPRAFSWHLPKRLAHQLTFRTFYTNLDHNWRRKVPWSSTTDFGPSKAEETGQNHNHSTTPSSRRSHCLLVAFIPATGPPVDFFVNLTPIWTMFGAKKYPGAEQLILDLRRQRRPAQTITTALPLHPDDPRAFSRNVLKRLAHQLTFS